MDVKKDFAERVDEINAYLDLLDAITHAAQSGAPKIGEVKITAQQQRILYSSVFLQLYNLTEATVTWCLKAITQATTEDDLFTPGHLSEDMLREWVKSSAKTSVPLNANNRLEEMLKFCKLVLSGDSLGGWSVAMGGGGNWDDRSIEDLAKRLGLSLAVTKDAKTAVKKVIRDDDGALVLVRKLRNKLAHGSISFTECGADVTPKDLRNLTKDVTLYLSEVVDLFATFVQTQQFLKPSTPSVPGGVS